MGRSQGAGGRWRAAEGEDFLACAGARRGAPPRAAGGLWEVQGSGRHGFPEDAQLRVWTQPWGRCAGKTPGTQRCLGWLA